LTSDEAVTSPMASIFDPVQLIMAQPSVVEPTVLGPEEVVIKVRLVPVVKRPVFPRELRSETSNRALEIFCVIVSEINTDPER
jgi:hypothetical protein